MKVVLELKLDSANIVVDLSDGVDVRIEPKDGYKPQPADQTILEATRNTVMELMEQADAVWTPADGDPVVFAAKSVALHLGMELHVQLDKDDTDKRH